MSSAPPKIFQRLVEPDGTANKVWYSWFNGLASAAPADAPTVDLSGYLPITTTVKGTGAIGFSGTLADGTVLINLRTLEDSGAGTFKLLERDSYGRLSGTADGAAEDVPYDPTASGLAAVNVQAAVDELSDEKLNDAPSDGTTYGRKDGAWVVAGGGGGSLAASTAVLASNVAISTTTETDVIGISLAAGTYIVTASWTAIGVAQSPDLYITDGTTYWAACTVTMNASEYRFGSITGIVTIAATTTVKLRMKGQTTSTATFSASSVRAGKPGATRIVALQIA